MRKLLIFFTLFIFSAYSFTGDEVEKYVKEQHSKVFNYINSSEEILKNDRNRFLLGLEKNLKDLIISQEISKRVLGKKNYKIASKKQRKDFDLKFKNTLFDTYSTALSEIDETNIIIVSHVHPNERLDLAIVKMRVNVSESDFDLIYKMKKINTRWKVIGIILDGIDLIGIFRKQFNKLLLDSDNNFDLAIQNWELDS
ncbi:ABC transporter substrate-binding protein [SAR86 cluster bacterium]|jgi:ABC-type transporter MlaC component|nr:ABC transporter substrate-binding protein [SAR86 cluster bacterium]|tara:strand:+ start:587 stop:1180 length:594 start_codon:yes stop_codon:yes gene_type:complete